MAYKARFSPWLESRGLRKIETFTVQAAVWVGAAHVQCAKPMWTRNYNGRQRC